MTQDARAAATALIDRFFAALAARDGAALAGLCVDDVVYDGRDGARSFGREKLRDALIQVALRGERRGDAAITVDEGGTRAAAEFTLRGGAGGASAVTAFEIEPGAAPRLSRVSDYGR